MTTISTLSEIFLNKSFFAKSINDFHVSLGPIMSRIKKTSLELIQNYKHMSYSRPNWAQNGPFNPNENFPPAPFTVETNKFLKADSKL